MSKIKLIAIGAGVLLVALAVWYVQGLRADNARLSLEVAQYKTVMAAQAANLADMQAASRIVGEEQAKAKANINAMNKELAAVRARQGEDNAQSNHDAVANTVAGQLKRLFCP